MPPCDYGEVGKMPPLRSSVTVAVSQLPGLAISQIWYTSTYRPVFTFPSTSTEPSERSSLIRACPCRRRVPAEEQRTALDAIRTRQRLEASGLRALFVYFFLLVQDQPDIVSAACLRIVYLTVSISKRRRESYSRG